MKVGINIFNDSSFKYLPKKKVVESVKKAFIEEKSVNVFINIVYVNDREIIKLNKRYLKHNRTTDVISFLLEEHKNTIEGEIYISVDTAINQAKQYKVSLSNELKRLAVHGALHLMGYNDDTIAKKQIMHKLENKYIGNY